MLDVAGGRPTDGQSPPPVLLINRPVPVGLTEEGRETETGRSDPKDPSLISYCRFQTDGPIKEQIYLQPRTRYVSGSNRPPVQPICTSVTELIPSHRTSLKFGVNRGDRFRTFL